MREQKRNFFEKFKIPLEPIIFINFFQIQSQTSLNINSFIKNYLSQYKNVCSSHKKLQIFFKNSKPLKIQE